MQLTELFDNPSALVSVSYLREATAEGTATQTAASNRKINFFDITLRMLLQRYVFIRNRKITRQAVSRKKREAGADDPPRHRTGKPWQGTPCHDPADVPSAQSASLQTESGPERGGRFP